METANRPQRKRALRPDRFIGWALFQFRVDNTLICVPLSWINSSKRVDMQGKVKPRHQCWWPLPGSEAEKNLTVLIQNQSQPDKESWKQMQGRMLGEYESRESAERALKQKDGTFSTSDGDQELEKNEMLKASVRNENLPSIPRILSVNGNQQGRSVQNISDSETSAVSSASADTGATEKSSGTSGIVERLDRIEKKIDTLLSGDVNIDLNEGESGKPYTSAIMNMSSSRPDIRAKSSAMACLHDLGFPVSSSDSLIERNENLEGTDPKSIRRRNALVNCLLCQVPKSQSTLTTSIRQCLYSMAPASVWQFFSGHGQSGSKKKSFADEITHIYKAVMVAVTQQTQSSLKTASSGISEVLKTMPNRKSAINFRLSVEASRVNCPSTDDESSDSTLIVSDTDNEDIDQFMGNNVNIQ